MTGERRRGHQKIKRSYGWICKVCIADRSREWQRRRRAKAS